MLHKAIGQSIRAKAKGSTGGINYLTGYRWRHSMPEVLRGNLDVTRELLSHEDNSAYTHGVLSYEENALDVPQSEQDFAMNLMEETLLAGFPPGHVDVVWIRHDDKEFNHERGSGRLELNYHIVNRDIVTGKKITPYLHKYDVDRVNLAKQIINDRFGYTSPDDPRKARAINLQGYGSELKGAAKKLNDFVINGIETEQIDSRDDIIKALQQRDDVEHVAPNKSDTYLVVKLKGASRNLRLKGIIYGKDFTDLAGLQQKQTDDGQRFDQDRGRRLADNIKELQRLNSIRAEKRSRTIKPKQKRGRKPKAAKPQQLERNQEASQQLDSSNNQPSNRQHQRLEQPSAVSPQQPKQDKSELQADARERPTDVGGKPPSADNAESLSGQVPTDSTDSVSVGLTDRHRHWGAFTVLDYIEKPKPKSTNNEPQHQHQENTDSTTKTPIRAREDVVHQERPSGTSLNPELGKHRDRMGGIHGIARDLKALARRLRETVRGNIEAIRGTVSRAFGSGELNKDYDELERKCRHLDRLLRDRGSIGITLDNDLDIEINPEPDPEFEHTLDTPQSEPEPQEPEPFKPAIAFQEDEATKALQAQIDAKQKADSKPAPSVQFERPKY